MALLLKKALALLHPETCRGSFCLSLPFSHAARHQSLFSAAGAEVHTASDSWPSGLQHTRWQCTGETEELVCKQVSGVTPRGGRPHLPYNLTWLICPHYFLLCHRGGPAWYDMRLFPGLRRQKKKGGRTM